jgi:hypothetical protein
MRLRASQKSYRSVANCSQRTCLVSPTCKEEGMVGEDTGALEVEAVFQVLDVLDVEPSY